MPCPNTSLENCHINEIFEKAKKIFFIGIGGISMGSLAEYCVSRSKKVYGYDKVRNSFCEKLEKSCKIRYCSSPDSVLGMDMVVYTAAIDPECMEYKKAIEMKIPTISRANFLGYVTSLCKNRIGIAGMHGKSTTCSMCAHIFEKAEKNPTVFCGAEMKNFSSPLKIGGGEYAIFEACEYENSFLSMSPTDAVITNIDYDHPDFFGSEAEIIMSFEKYAKKAMRVFINADNEKSLLINSEDKITYGIKNQALYQAKNIHSDAKNGTFFEVCGYGKHLCDIHMRQYGAHNIQNALCAFAVSHENGIDKDIISAAFESFEGSSRRGEFLKITNTGKPLFIDYAHHPAEIRACLDGLCGMGYKKIFCVFQSHTYSRTYALYKDFTGAFSGAYRLIVTPIYAARETNVYGICESRFAKDCGGIFMSDFCEIASVVQGSDADCIAIMGAGDIDRLCNFID